MFSLKKCGALQPALTELLPTPILLPNDVLTKIRLRRESLNSVQKLNPKEVKGSLVSHISPYYF